MQNAEISTPLRMLVPRRKRFRRSEVVGARKKGARERDQAPATQASAPRLCFNCGFLRSFSFGRDKIQKGYKIMLVICDLFLQSLLKYFYSLCILS